MSLKAQLFANGGKSSMKTFVPDHPFEPLRIPGYLGDREKSPITAGAGLYLLSGVLHDVRRDLCRDVGSMPAEPIQSIPDILHHLEKEIPGSYFIRTGRRISCRARRPTPD